MYTMGFFALAAMVGFEKAQRGRRRWWSFALSALAYMFPDAAIFMHTSGPFDPFSETPQLVGDWLLDKTRSLSICDCPVCA
jgi:hypothetical protein